MDKVKSGFLFADPSFAAGAARTLDLWGQFDAYNESESVEEADGKAIAADWILVGEDIQSAIEHYRKLSETLHSSE